MMRKGWPMAIDKLGTGQPLLDLESLKMRLHRGLPGSVATNSIRVTSIWWDCSTDSLTEYQRIVLILLDSPAPAATIV